MFCTLLKIDREPLTDPAPIDWILGHLEFGGTVGAWVAGGFDRYARLLHPAQEGLEAHRGSISRPVRWRELSAWSGKPLHRASWSDDLLLRSDGATWQAPGSDRNRPAEGQLLNPDFDRLVDLLARATGTPQQLWLLVWNGYGGGQEGVAMEVSPSLTASARTYLLHRGAFESGMGHQIGSGPAFREPPSFWWPEDRAWFVSTDIDSTSTYVGGSADLVDRLLADEGLEGFPAQLEDPIDGSPNW
jgi:hypothetical protein